MGRHLNDGDVGAAGFGGRVRGPLLHSPAVPQPSYLEVVVSGITADAYRYYKSQQRYYENLDNPYAKLASLVSNIRNGYGLFGGATDAYYRLKLPQRRLALTPAGGRDAIIGVSSLPKISGWRKRTRRQLLRLSRVWSFFS